MEVYIVIYGDSEEIQGVYKSAEKAFKVAEYFNELIPYDIHDSFVQIHDLED